MCTNCCISPARRAVSVRVHRVHAVIINVIKRYGHATSWPPLTNFVQLSQLSTYINVDNSLSNTRTRRIDSPVTACLPLFTLRKRTIDLKASTCKLFIFIDFICKLLKKKKNNILSLICCFLKKYKLYFIGTSVFLLNDRG